MSNGFWWRAVAVVAVLAGSLVLWFTRSVRLGLDLEGGTQIVLEAQGEQVDGDTIARTLEVLRRRVDALGVAEPSLQRSGDRRIIVELPGVADPDDALEVIGKTAQLAFHPVLGTAAAADTTAPIGESTTTGRPPDEGLVLVDEEGSRLRLGPSRVTGEGVSGARARFESGRGWEVDVDFRGEGRRQWGKLTGEAACAPAGDPTRRVAIVLDREIISSPQVSPEIACREGIAGGKTVITGRFKEREAKDLALLIRAGALPVPVEVVEQRTIGPTLGAAAIRASVQAAVIGAALTIIYMIGYYRVLGGLAALGLLAYGVVSFAALLAMRATLTLPGIAGFVLAVGMAVDANVLVFERAKEEHAGERSPRVAVRNGFRRAWSAIADSNVTTLLAAVLLFFYASGGVRGFGVTVIIGVLVSMFTALVLTRVLAEMALRSPRLSGRPQLLGLDTGGRLRAWLAERGPDLMGRRRRWFTFSALAVAIAVTGLATRGLPYGLEFSGGRLLEYDTTRSADVDRLRSELAEVGLPRALVSESAGGHVTIRTAELSDAEEARVAGAVERAGGAAEVVRDEFVGPTIGDELRRKALIALGLALAAQLAYLAVRFRWTYGAAAVVAMAHDVVIVLGVFAWLGKPFDGVFLAALLTVIGYSVNDSVVVFDRIREQRRARAREPLSVVANDACLQTVPRTVNTGLGALFILAALYVLGGDTLTDFALALLVGIAAGTYSSVFTAAPLAVVFEGLGSPAAPSPGRPPTRVQPPARATVGYGEKRGSPDGEELAVGGRRGARPEQRTTPPRPRRPRQGGERR